jgi:DNA-binding phage protein
MTGPSTVVPREIAFANARRVLDHALNRIARDRAAGRLAPEAELTIRRLERAHRDKAEPNAPKHSAA